MSRDPEHSDNRLTTEIVYSRPGDRRLVELGLESADEDDLSRELRQHLGQGAYRLAELTNGFHWDLRSILEEINHGRVHGFGTPDMFEHQREQFDPTRFIVYLLDDLPLGERVASHFLEHFNLPGVTASEQTL